MMNSLITKTKWILLMGLFLTTSVVQADDKKEKPKSFPEFSTAKVPFSAIASNLEYKGIAVKEEDYTVWGAAPVMDGEGKTISLTIKATVDSPLRLKDPFGGEPYTSNLSMERSGEDLTCQMKAGQALKMSLKSQ